MAKTVSMTNISVNSLFFVTSNMLVVMLVIILTFYEVSGRYVKLPLTAEFLITSKDGNVFKNSNKRELTKNLDFDAFITIADDEYPGKELAKIIVDESKKIMQSHNKARRQQIKTHTPYDSSHLSHLVLSSKENLNSLSDNESCIKSTMELDLKYLRNDFIIKTESLGESVTIVKCRLNESCGSCYNQPLGYKSVCTQIFTKIKFYKLPVNKEIKTENQEMLSINVPTGCKCSLKNKDDEIYSSIN